MSTKEECILELKERGAKILFTEKFARHLCEVEHDARMGVWEMVFVGQSLGEELGQVEYPAQWRRLLKRKDCPKYMREIVVSKVTAYYPKLSLPKEEHWVSFESPATSN